MSEDEIDENLEESFPASDPPSWNIGTNHRAGKASDEDGKNEDKESEMAKTITIEELKLKMDGMARVNSIRRRTKQVNYIFAET